VHLSESTQAGAGLACNRRGLRLAFNLLTGAAGLNLSLYSVLKSRLQQCIASDDSGRDHLLIAHFVPSRGQSSFPPLSSELVRSYSSRPRLLAINTLRWLPNLQNFRGLSRTRTSRTPQLTTLLDTARLFPLVSERLPAALIRAADREAPLVNNEQRFQQPPVTQQAVPGGIPQGAYRQEQTFPVRTTSHRNSQNLSLEQSQNLQHSPGPQPQQTSPGFEQARRGSHQPQQSSPPYVQEPKKQSLRSRIAAGLSGHKDYDEPSRNPSKNGVDRRRSVRKSEGSPPENYQPPANINPNQLQAAQWNQRQASNQHLPVSNEQDEDDDVDPFLQRDDPNIPAPPPKDGLQYQQHSQQLPPQFTPNPHQEQQFNRPPPQLARVNTQTQGGVEQHYSPEQHSGSQQSLYQSYSPPAAQHQQNPTEYTAFNPQAAQSTGSVPLHAPQPQAPPQQQNYYQYQQQAQQQALQQTQQTPSPQEVASQYQQPPQFGSQPHQGSQEFPQHSQQGRPPSQHQPPELQHPQATRPIPQIVQQGQQQIDTQSVQQLRPPSSQQQFAPPSPIQPPPYQSYDAKSAQQPTQGVDTPTQNTTPPQQGQDSMPPSGAQQRNTLRKVNEAGGPPPGPSREGSLLLQQPTGQAQGQQPPVSPGAPTFGANVVPTASQGQPYRGEKGQQAQGGELGRATPPPRSATDMSDEELHQLIKDHEVLRKCRLILGGQNEADSFDRREVPEG
jgi:hypothetical protein